MKDYVPFDIYYWLRLLRNLKIDYSMKSHSALPLDERLSKQKELFSIEPTIENNPQEDDLLENIIEEKRIFFGKEINKLDLFQKYRLQINFELKYWIDYAIMSYRSLIYNLDLWPRGYNSMIEKRRIHLERICNTLEQEKRREITSCWKDMLTVTRDLRAILREYMELSIRKRIVRGDRNRF